MACGWLFMGGYCSFLGCVMAACGGLWLLLLGVGPLFLQAWVP